MINFEELSELFSRKNYLSLTLVFKRGVTIIL